MHGGVGGFGGGLQLVIHLNQKLTCPLGVAFHVISVVLLGSRDFFVSLNDVPLCRCQVRMYFTIDIDNRLLCQLSRRTALDTKPQ